MIRGLIPLLILCSFSSLSLAQEYVPPPLFGAPETVSPKPAPVKNDEEPRTAPITPKPKEKPNFISVKDLPASNIETKPLPKKNIPPPPVTRGVVKGPKTMPSAPAKSVEAEVLYEAPKQEAKPLLIQNQEKAMKKAEKPEFVPPLPTFKVLSEETLQSTIYFVSITETLSETNKATIKHLIIPELEKNDKKKLLIQAYASPQNDVLSGDRRISLSRALNVRRFLIENGINPSRLNVRALGASTNTQPLDRVELIIS